MPLDKKSGPWDIAPGAECYACHTDGYYYLAVLGEVSGMYAHVTFDANRGFTHKEAPASGTAARVPLSDIRNVSWGIQNLDAEYTGRIIKVYSMCVFMRQLEDGRLLVYEDGDQAFEHKITYDCLRFPAPAEPFFPAAAEAAASVTGRKSADLNTLRQRLMQSIDRGLGIAKGGDYSLMGRTIRVSSARARLLYLRRLYNQYEAGIKAFNIKHGTAKITNMDQFLEMYDRVADYFGEIQTELIEILIKAGFAVTPGKVWKRYESKISDVHQARTIEEYNEIVYKKNDEIIKYNYAAGLGLTGLDTLEYRRNIKKLDQNAAIWKKNVNELIEGDMTVTLLHMMYHDVFLPAVNDYAGEKYFDMSAKAYAESADDLWGRYRLLSAAEREGPAGLDLLLGALERNPFDRPAYRELLLFHSKPGDGLTEFIDELHPGQALAAQMKYDLVKEWLPGGGAAVYPKDSADETLGLLGEKLGRFELTRETAAPLFDLKAIIEGVYALHDIVYDPMLNRLAYGQRPDNPNHSALLQKLDGVRDSLLATRPAPACQTGKEALLSVCQPLRELIEQDSRTVRGRVFASHGEMKTAAARTQDVTDAFYNTDFSQPGAVAAIDRMIDAHEYGGLLQPYKEKARRAADLSVRRRDFSKSVGGRQYSSRQQLIYDIMQADILDNERLLLWMKRDNVSEWYDEQTAGARRVFGRRFSGLAEANEYYYDVMDGAWIYQEYLNEKSNTQAGFFKKLGTAIAGIGKKDYEPAYNAATENGAKTLTPLAPEEREATRSYWQYALDEKERLYEEYCSRYDPAAIDGRKRMTEIKATIDSFANGSALQSIRDGLLSGGWKPRPRPAEPAAEAHGFSIDDITEPLAEGETRAAYQAKRPVVTVTLPKTVYAKKEQMKFDVSGITARMQAYKAFVSVYGAGAPHGDYGDYGYLKQGLNNCLFSAPKKPGPYEVRVYKMDLEYTDETLLTSVPFTVV